MKNRYPSKLTIITGLPGAGKTTLAKKMKGRVLSLDKVDFSKPVWHFVSLGYEDHLIIEGLITGDTFFRILDWIKTGLNPVYWDKIKSIEVISFEDDREACLWNDRARGRDKDARITIENMEITFPEPAEFKARFPEKKFRFKTLPVVRADRALVWAVDSAGVSPYSIRNRKPNQFAPSTKSKPLYLYGESWCLGGTWGDCWGGSGTVSASEPVDDFRELDELLSRVAPGITYLQYRNMARECVSTETYSEGDYYGGSTQHAVKVCDLRKLYDWLRENNLLEDE